MPPAAEHPNLELTGIDLKFLEHLKEPGRRADAKNRFEKQLKIIEMTQNGTPSREELQQAAPKIGIAFISAVCALQQSQAEQCWQQEFAKRFSLLGKANTSRDWNQVFSTGQTWAARAQEWMRVPSWAFCPECGRKEPKTQVAWHWRKHPTTCVQRPCPNGCDLPPLTLQQGLPRPLTTKETGNLKAYVTPQEEHWRQWILHFAPDASPSTKLHEVVAVEELRALAVVDLYVKFEKKVVQPMESRQKRSVIRATWRAISPEAAVRTEAGRRAYEWLIGNNHTYKAMVEQRQKAMKERADGEGHRWIDTRELLLFLPGLEVGARPWLYPYEAFGDTDLAARLKTLGRIPQASTPSLKTSAYRKFLSRCLDYTQDYELHCFLYDVAMARTISSVVNIAEQKKMAPEVFASDMAAFEMYWHREGQKLEDVCRQAKKMPELFFTLAPAEWKFPLHQGALPPADPKELSKQQILLTEHIHNVLQALIRRLVTEDGDALASCGIAKIQHWVMRFEFQKRGTIHVHVLCWLQMLPGRHPSELTGRSKQKHSSAFVNMLESSFDCSVDAQGGECHNNLLKYVTGYVAKASDALQFRSKDRQDSGNPQANSLWRQVFRMLSKRSPMEQEMAMDMANLSMVRASFTGAYVHAPIPGSTAINNDRHLYNAFQQWLVKDQVSLEGDDPKDPDPQKTNFLEWCRFFDIRNKKLLEDEVDACGRQKYHYALRRRNVANRGGRGSGKVCAVAMQFPFELLDIFVGSWAAVFLKNLKETDVLPEPADRVPENMAHLSALLKHAKIDFLPEGSTFWQTQVKNFIYRVWEDLNIRGLGESRMQTFGHRIMACARVLREVALERADPALWSANRLFEAPRRIWSPEQQLVLNAIEQGTTITDANDLAVPLEQRVLWVTGGPGTGKTEVVIAAALAATDRGCRVLVGTPTGQLASEYRRGHKILL